ncbi:DNA methyltransferase [Archaeoglobus sp.]
MSWAFEGANTRYLTHDIHRYPAKFIPQVVRRIIEEYSQKGDIVLDPFCGSGTALLEARLVGRNAIGVDLNPVAYYVSKVKANPIEPRRLKRLWSDFSQKLSPLFGFDRVKPYPLPKKALEVLSSWIPKRQLLDMRRLFTLIMEVKDEDFRDFLLVGFSNIQKNCSWWLMKSVKPTRDFNKKVPDVIPTFVRQVEEMIKKNNELWSILRDSKTWVRVFKADARELSSVVTDSVDLIVFSPPYVTSYEYVDVHKLSVIWLEQVDDLRPIKQKFIGSLSARPKNVAIKSSLAMEIIRELSNKDGRLAKAVKTYFEDMQLSFKEMDKVLKDDGIISIVIGNTKLKKVDVKNAEVFAEIFVNMGYKLERVIKRPIPSKNLPTVRDPKTGKFTSVSSSHVKVYPHEFILFLRKV